MDVKASGAVEAYVKALKQAAEGGKGAGGDVVNVGGGGQNSGQSFADMVSNVVQDSVSVQHNGEAVSMAALNKEADLVSIVTAVTDAEITLQTVVAVRDRVVGAYQEIMRMPI